MPRALLQGSGVDLADLGDYRFLGHHDNVAWAIVNGEVDAGGLLESLAQKFVVKGLRIISTSEPIPEFNFCGSPELSPALRRNITEALLQLDAARTEDKNILNSLESGYNGFMPAADKDYAGIETAGRCSP